MEKTLSPRMSAMSALGQKQTFAVQNGMFALPPKADMCSANSYVRFGPNPEVGTTRLPGSNWSSDRSYLCNGDAGDRSEEHTSELQSLRHLVCRLLLEKKKNRITLLSVL